MSVMSPEFVIMCHDLVIISKKFAESGMLENFAVVGIVHVLESK